MCVIIGTNNGLWLYCSYLIDVPYNTVIKLSAYGDIQKLTDQNQIHEIKTYLLSIIIIIVNN
ncbi:hypothetical protein D3C73_1354890 [compost metagenome]